MRPIPTAAALLLALVPSPAAAAPPAWTAAGIAGWAPALVLLAGLVLLAVEMFVVPGFGWAGMLGILAVVGGVILAVSPAPMEAAFVFAALVSSLTLLGIAVWNVASRMRAGHPLLGGMLRRDEGYVAAAARPELEGREGVALTDLRPAGTALVDGEQLDVVSDAGWIAAGAPLRVLHAEGYRHVVQPLALPPADERADPPAAG